MKKFLLSPILAAVVGGATTAVILLVTGLVGSNSHTVVKETAPYSSKTAQTNPHRANEIYNRDSEGVVHIRSHLAPNVSETPFGFVPESRIATGSGFVVDKEGYIFTNAHVIHDSKKVQVSFKDDRLVNAKVVGEDLDNDLALLKVDPKNLKLKPLELGDSDKIRVGDPLFAIGNPFGFDRTLTTGVVSALQRKIKAPNGFVINDVIQTDAAINPGNSGGPLIEGEGRVVGINSKIVTGGGNGNVGIGFAVPINTAKKIFNQLKKNGKVDRAYLGVIGIGIEGVVKALNVKADSGVLIQKVVGNSPAKKAGIRGANDQVMINGEVVGVGGDIIQKVDGKAVRNWSDLTTLLGGYKPTDEVTIDLIRNGKKKIVRVKLANKPALKPQQ